MLCCIVRQHCTSRKDLLKSGGRLTLPVLPNNNIRLLSRPQLQRNQVLMLDNKAVSTFSNDLSQIPSAIHNTTGHLRSRHTEVSQWQTHISDSICQVDQEIAALEQMKDVSERCIHEKQMYNQLMSDCVALSGSLSSLSLDLSQDLVLSDLKKEQQLTNESIELLQNHICTLLDKMSSLQEIRTQLLADFQDKCEAIRLTTKCITHGFNNPSFQQPATQYNPPHLSYDDWLSHCKSLRHTADDLIKESSLLRRNMQFCLGHIKCTQEYLRRITHGSLRRKIQKLARVQETLKWESQRTLEDISDFSKDIQKVASQIRNWDSSLHQATHCLEMLNQRPRYELCLDYPYISFTLLRHDLAKTASGFPLALKHAQKNLELAHKRREILEDKLAKNAHAMHVSQRCYNMHQSFQPVLYNAVVLAKKPALYAAPGLVH